MTFKKIFLSILVILNISLLPSSLLAQEIHTMAEAKKQARIIWGAHRTSVYCGCQFDKYLNVSLSSCHYVPLDLKRAKRIEWEHIVPVSWFGQGKKCWQKKICRDSEGVRYKGRECCELKDKEFRKMMTDLHNLIPVIGEVNAARKNYPFGELSMEEKKEVGFYHNCEIYIDTENRLVEPRDEIKGLIARAHLYMANKYGVSMRQNQLRVMMEWNKKYPPSEWEREWNQKIVELTGVTNEFIEYY